ncbi:MAG: hypothetical protein P4L69_15710, partial [Desulfosporosinus sp.]|nr:hypothetical protein [Desulfosporosinus sp.]
IWFSNLLRHYNGVLKSRPACTKGSRVWHPLKMPYIRTISPISPESRANPPISSRDGEYIPRKKARPSKRSGKLYSYDLADISISLIM